MLGRGELQYLAGVLAELDEVTASPGRITITAYDYTHMRRISYTPLGGYGGEGPDVGLDGAALYRIARRVRGEAHVSVTPERLVVKSDGMTFRLRLLEAAGYMDEPAASHIGEVSIPVADLRLALQDVRAAGTSSVVIVIDGGDVIFRGEGASDCRIGVPAAEATGVGYSRLDLDMLMPCIPNLDGRTATILLAPKGPTLMRFGDDLTYHQAPRL